MLFLQQELFLTQQRFSLEVRHTKQVRKKGPGYPIRLCDCRHFPVDTAMQPSEHDDIDTRLGGSIWASRTLHREASGWWGMVMNLQDS